MLKNSRSRIQKALKVLEGRMPRLVPITFGAIFLIYLIVLIVTPEPFVSEEEMYAHFKKNREQYEDLVRQTKQILLANREQDTSYFFVSIDLNEKNGISDADGTSIVSIMKSLGVTSILTYENRVSFRYDKSDKYLVKTTWDSLDVVESLDDLDKYSLKEYSSFYMHLEGEWYLQYFVPVGF